MKLLMHICCANCALYPMTVMEQRGIELKALWFNPNIHPYTEYRNRLDAVSKLQELRGFTMECCDDYGLREFLRNVVHREEDRCIHCYTVRLDETAKRAKKAGADAFTTSLLVSPYQKFGMIIDIGRMMQERYSVEFYGEDFRSGFRKGRSMGRELGLYQQKYCGCVYSEMERYLKKNPKANTEVRIQNRDEISPCF